MRNLRLTEYFANENDIIFNEETQPLVKSKATGHPLKETEIKCLIWSLIF